MSDVEQPKYDIIEQNSPIEIRQYSALIVSEVVVKNTRKLSINEGFKLIADYIFGNNQQQTKINMTAPVTQQKSENGWIIRFMMPAEHSLDTLPKPENPAVKIKKIDQKKFVVIRFSGLSSEDSIKQHEFKLTQYILDNDLKTHNSPIYAFYNPPWTLPF
ncbi:heme-binding protein, partial [Candidatus Thioglobus sp.]|uniref:SOUL family heme-binding protein n=1 Tax=Candidatus Thioglobus sp. TaxID=2026721 RepID=UPI002624930E